MAQTTFKYKRTATGALSGQSLVEQTELAIDEIRDFAQAANANAELTTSIAKEAVKISENAEEVAKSAVDVSENTANRQTVVEERMVEVEEAWGAVRDEWANARTVVNGYVADAIDSVQESIESAEQAKQNIDGSIATAESLKEQLDNIDDTIIVRGEEIVAEINTGKDAALAQIAQKTNESVSTINGEEAKSIEAIRAEIGKAEAIKEDVDASKQYVTEVYDEAVRVQIDINVSKGTVTTAKLEALQAIEAERSNTLTAVLESKSDALDNITLLRDSALDAIDSAEIQSLKDLTDTTNNSLNSIGTSQASALSAISYATTNAVRDVESTESKAIASVTKVEKHVQEMGANVETLAGQVQANSDKVAEDVAKVVDIEDEVKSVADNIDDVRVIGDDLRSVLVQSIKLGRITDPIGEVNLATGGAIVTVAKNIEAIRKVAESLGA